MAQNQSNPIWSQLKNQSTLGNSADDQLQQIQDLLNSGAVPSGGPAAPPTAPTAVGKTPKATKKSSSSTAASSGGAPTQPSDGTQSNSPGVLNGRFDTHLTNDELRDIEARNRTFFMDPGDMKDRISKLMQIPEYAEQAKGIRDQKDLIAMEAAQPKQADLSGLMGLADTLSNNKYDLRGGYKAPGDKAKELLANMDKAQDNQRDLTKSIVALANSGKAGMDINTLNTLGLIKTTFGDKPLIPRGTGGNPGNQTLAFGRATQSEAKDLKSRGEMLDTLVNTLTSSNPTALQSIPALAARFIEGTVRPQLAVIQREGGDPSFWQSSLNKLEKMANGQMPKEQVGQYADFFRGLQKQHQRDVAGAQARWKVMANKINLSDKDFKDMVGSGWVNPHQDSTTDALANAPGNGGAGGPQLSNHDQKIQDAIKSNEALMKKLDDLQKGGK